jgi:hypothetical protein
MTLLGSKNWAQRNAVLSDLSEANPNKADKGKETEGHSIVLEISSKEELLLHCLKLKIFQETIFTSFPYG